MVYGIFTAGQRTWGGPRVDAVVADSKITPQEAIEQAEAAGDDLNVVPETFKPAVEARRRRLKQTTLQPSSSVEGRFAPADAAGSTWPTKLSPSPSVHTDLNEKDLEAGHEDSTELSDSEGISVHTPRRVPTSIRASGHFSHFRSDDIADPAELTRRLTMITSPDARHSTWYSSVGRSPLGRISPLNAASIPSAQTHAQQRAQTEDVGRVSLTSTLRKRKDAGQTMA